MEDNSPHFRYSALSHQDDFVNPYLPSRGDGGETEGDLRYQFELHEKISWTSIFLGLFLLVVGTILLITGHFIFSGHMDGDGSQAYTFFTLGTLLLLPGYYATRIAYYTWRGYKGFKFPGIRDY